MTRPEFIAYQGEYENSSLFDIKQMIHPCVTLQNGKNFIPNDTYIEPGNGG
jgi:DNA mismatch repair ATPase MutS